MRDWILPVAMIVVACCILVAALQRDHASHLATACNNTGQFTANGVTYRCGEVTQETLNAAYNRQFERCRTWLHNPWRDRELPLIRNDNE